MDECKIRFTIANFNNFNSLLMRPHLSLLISIGTRVCHAAAGSSAVTGTELSEARSLTTTEMRNLVDARCDIKGSPFYIACCFSQEYSPYQRTNEVVQCWERTLTLVASFVPPTPNSFYDFHRALQTNMTLEYEVFFLSIC